MSRSALLRAFVFFGALVGAAAPRADGAGFTLTHPLRIVTDEAITASVLDGRLHSSGPVTPAQDGARSGIATLLGDLPLTDVFLRRNRGAAPSGGIAIAPNSVIGLRAGRTSHRGEWQGGVAIRLDF